MVLNSQHLSTLGCVLALLLLKISPAAGLINQLSTASSHVLTPFTQQGGVQTSANLDLTTSVLCNSLSTTISNMATCVVDDSIFADFSNGGCLQYTVANVVPAVPTQVGFVLTLGSPVSARSFLSNLTPLTLSDPSFLASTTTLKMELWLGGVYLNMFTAQGTNAVWTTNAIIEFDMIKLYAEYLAPALQQTFCLGDIFALKEYYLNDLLQPSVVVNQLILHPWVGPMTYENYPAGQYVPMSSSFTQNSAICQVFTPFPSTLNLPYPQNTFVQVFHAACFGAICDYFRQYYYKSPFLTSAFYQVGALDVGATLNLQWKNFTYVNTPLPLGAWTDAGWASPAAIGSQFVDFTTDPTYKPGIVTPGFTVRAFGVTAGNTQAQQISFQLCSFQYFGYGFCQVNSKTWAPSPVSFTYQVPVGSTSISIPLTFTSSLSIDVPLTTLTTTSFCYLGLKVDAYINGTFYATQALTNNHITLETSFTFVYPITATNPVNNTLSFVISDSRDTITTTTNKITTEDFYIYEYWCTTSVFNQVQPWYIQLQDGSALTDVSYNGSSGQIESIQFKFNSGWCNGLYLVPQVYLVTGTAPSQTQTPVNSDPAVFAACQLIDGEMCFLFNSDNYTLQYFAKELDTQGRRRLTQTSNTYSLSTTVLYNFPTNSVAIPISAVWNMVVTSSATRNQVTTSCSSTTFAPVLAVNQQLLEYLVPQEAASGTEFTGAFTDSFSILQGSTDGMSYCGKRSFKLEANASDPNFYLAHMLLTNCIGCLTLIVSSDNLEFSLWVEPQRNMYAGQKLVYVITVGLLSYQSTSVNPLKSFELTIAFQNSIRPQKSEFYAEYVIGIANPPIYLPTYDIFPKNVFIGKFSVVQVGGNVDLDPSTFYVNNFKSDANKQFIMQTNDMTLVGSQVTFQFTATLNSTLQEKDSSLQLIVSITAANLQQALENNTPPTFQSTLTTPEELPCIDANSALRWSYKLPKVFDAQGDLIQFSIKCAGLDSQIFTQTVINDVATLFIKSSSGPGLQPFSGILACQITLADSKNATSIYPVNFKTACQKKTIKVSTALIEPIPYISSIESNGTMTLVWSVDMTIPLNESSSNSGRKLIQNDCFQASPLSGKIVPNLTLEIGRIYQNVSLHVSEYKLRETKIQLFFKNPSNISISQKPNTIAISFLNTACFVSKTNITMNSSIQLISQLPRQDTLEVLQLPQSLEQAMQGALYAVGASFVFSFWLSALLNYLLSLISSLSIILHMFLVNLNYPVQMMKFFGTLFPLVVFDILPTTTLNEDIFHFTEITNDYFLSDQFNTIGYQSIFSVNNIGSLHLMIFAGVIYIFMLWLVKKCKMLDCSKWLQKRVDHVANRVLWSGTTQFCAQNFLVICVTSFIESNDLRVKPSYSFTEKYCSYFSIYGMIFGVAFPVLIVTVYRRSLLIYFDTKVKKPEQKEAYFREKMDRFNKAQLKKQQDLGKFIASSGVLIDGIRVNQIGAKAAILAAIIDLLFQLAIAVSVTRLITFPALVICVFNFAILIHLCVILCVKPYDDKWREAIVIVNDFTYLILNYHLILFTNFLDQGHYAYIANSCFCVICGNVCLNLLLTLAKVVLFIHGQLARHYYRYVYRSQQELLVEKQKSSKLDENGQSVESEIVVIRRVHSARNKKSNLKNQKTITRVHKKSVNFGQANAQTELAAQRVPPQKFQVAVGKQQTRLTNNNQSNKNGNNKTYVKSTDNQPTSNKSSNSVKVETKQSEFVAPKVKVNLQTPRLAVNNYPDFALTKKKKIGNPSSKKQGNITYVQNSGNQQVNTQNGSYNQWNNQVWQDGYVRYDYNQEQQNNQSPPITTVTQYQLQNYNDQQQWEINQLASQQTNRWSQNQKAGTEQEFKRVYTAEELEYWHTLGIDIENI